MPFPEDFTFRGRGVRIRLGRRRIGMMGIEGVKGSWRRQIPVQDALARSNVPLIRTPEIYACLCHTTMKLHHD